MKCRRCLHLSLVTLAAGLSMSVGCTSPSSQQNSGPPTPTPGAVSLQLNASFLSVPLGTAVQVTATVTNDAGGRGVTWSVSALGCLGPSCGTIGPVTTASGVAATYTAPGAVPTPATVTLTATSIADPTKTASAMITITGGFTLTLDPGVQFETWEAWRATATGPNYFVNGATQTVSDAVLSNYLDDMAHDLGLTGFRISQAGAQQPTLPNLSDPNLVTVNGTTYDFSKTWVSDSGATQDLTLQIKKVVLPLKARVEANGDPFSTYDSPSYDTTVLTNPQSASQFADYAQAFVTWLHLVGNFYPTYFTVNNEPDSNGPGEPLLDAAAVAMGQRLQSLGLPTKMQVLEDSHPSVSHLSSLFAVNGALDVTGIIAYHGYDYSAPGPPDFTERNNIRAIAQAHGLRTAMTEICCQAGWDGLTYPGALGWARDIYWNMTEANISIWEPLDMRNIIDFTHDLSGTFKGPSYYSLRQYAHYIRPRYIRIGFTCSGCGAGPVGQNLKPVAFQSPKGKNVLVIINDQSTAQTITIVGLPAGTYNTTGVTPQATAGTTFLAQMIVAGQPLVMNLPAQAIVTIVQQ
jgi:hypothetical protein